jgi:hypothetical protein
MAKSVLRGRLALLALLISLGLSIGPAVSATQHQSEPTPTPKVSQLPTQQPAVTGQPALMAKLIDAEKNAMEKTATVQAEVTGVQLIDPALTNKVPNKTQGHLHYRVDNGPIIATTATKLSFHELPPGKHKIQVVLAANDHSPMGPEQTLEITVP